MSTTIESLELEINSNSTQAVSGIDALSSSLSKLKNAIKGGVGLTSVANQVRNLDTALQSVDGSSADKIDKLANSLSKLSALGKIKISASIGNQIKNISSATAGLKDANYAAIDSLASSIKNLNGIGKASGLQSAITQLKKLPELAATLKDMDLDGLCSDLSKLSNALAPLASQANSVSNAFSKLPSSVNKLSQATQSASNSNDSAANSYINFWAKSRMAYNAVRTGAQVIGSWITKSNEYIEDLNLFTASMGEYASEAQKYAEQVGELMGIDPGQFMRYEGIFNTIIEGFGVASDRAYIMSKNLTQLGYDLSSFYNISFEDSMQKLQSGISGELEPLRRLGYDLSQARLQQEALNLGIEKSVSDMTQAEKSQLRYYAIMTQVTVAQGDMARTLNAPANQVRILQTQVTQCARALGEIFIPALNAVLPYAIAFAKVIRLVANEIASLFGFELPEVDYSSLSSNLSTGSDAISDMASGADDTASGLSDAADEAKKLNKFLLGIDELNVIPSTATANSGSGASGAGGPGGVGGGDLGIDLPTYDFLGDLVSTRVDEIVDKMKDKLKELLPIIASIGAGFAAWKIAKGLVGAIDKISGLLKGISFSLNFGTVGLLGFISDMNEFRKFFEDFLENGATFYNVAGMISEFVGMIGDALIMMGQLKVGGALKVAQGIGELITAIKDIGDNGVNWDNVTLAIRGITNVAIGIGVFSGTAEGLAVAGIALTIQGMLNVVTEVKNIIHAIKTGDWEAVDWINLFVGALEAVGGVVVAISAFKKIKAAHDISSAGADIAEVASTTTEVGSATETLNGSMSGLTGKLQGVAKNLGWGILIIGEVAASALIIVGSIALLGLELQAVGDAWTPVIENGKTTAEAVGLGALMLGAVGVATGLIGSAGGSLAAQMGIGILILGEIGVATALFVAEIWTVGELLNKVLEAWQPVLDNGENVAEAIGLGTALLVAIGVVTAALGAATVATVGALPLAIGLGTAILAEMGGATLLFIGEIWAIGEALNQVGLAWQPVLDNGDTIKTGIETGTALLVAIGVVTAALGVATVASVGLLPVAIALGTGMLTELSGALVSFCDNLEAVAEEMENDLAPALEGLNEKLPTLRDNMSSFVDFMEEFCDEVVRYSESTAISGIATTVSGIIDWFTSDPIESLASTVNDVYTDTQDLNDKLELAVPELQTARDLLQQYENFLDEIESLTSNNHELSTGMFVNMEEVGQSLVTGFVSGIESKSSDFSNAATTLMNGFKTSLDSGKSNTLTAMKQWADDLKKWFTGDGYGAINHSTFQKYAKEIVQGFSNGIRNNSSSTRSYMSSWANNIKSGFTDTVDRSTFRNYAANIVDGFNDGLARNYYSSRSWASAWGSVIESGFSDYANSKAFWNAAIYVINGFNNAVARNYRASRGYMQNWAYDIISTFRNALDINSPSKEFYQFGVYAIAGYNNAIKKLGKTSVPIMEAWGDNILASVPDVSAQFESGYGSLSTDIAQSVNAHIAVRDDEDRAQELYSSVYTAVINALRSENGNQEIKLYVDGKQMSSVVTRRQRQIARARGD